MSSPSPLATHDYQPGEMTAALDFLRRIRDEMSTVRKVRVWTDRLQVFDVNGDCFELRGLGYVDADVLPLLDAVNTVYKPESIHEAFDGEYKEFKTGRRYPWAQDRVM
jgi:hypothetical protein